MALTIRRRCHRASPVARAARVGTWFWPPSGLELGPGPRLEEVSRRVEHPARPVQAPAPQPAGPAGGARPEREAPTAPEPIEARRSHRRLGLPSAGPIAATHSPATKGSHGNFAPRIKKVAWRAAAHRYLKVAGVSLHIGSQITDVSPFAIAVQRAAELVRQLADDGHKISFLDVGGAEALRPPSHRAFAESTFILSSRRDRIWYERS